MRHHIARGYTRQKSQKIADYSDVASAALAGDGYTICCCCWSPVDFRWYCWPLLQEVWHSDCVGHAVAYHINVGTL